MKSLELYKKAKGLIPGGTQLLSKRPEMFLPDEWPAYYSRAKGCELWDLDGNKYIDMITMGIGACVLGYANETVDNKVIEAIRSGSMSSLNAPEEVELAELITKEIHPWADMVRYSRSGGEAMSIAIRIARACSGKDKIMFCGYHGWHDWYLAANLSEDEALDGHLLPGLTPKGVPRALKGTAIPFEYNNLDEFKRLLNLNENEVGVVVLEMIKYSEPNLDFLKGIRELTKSKNIVFVIDEITSGWRLNAGGAHLLYGIEPDIAVFGKATSNGYPFGAIIGRRSVMEAAQSTFISSTYWTDRTGTAAALASILEMKKLKLYEHLNKIGWLIQEGWKTLGQNSSVDINVFGIKPLSHFSINHEKGQLLKTYFTQEMLKKGFLASGILYTSLPHNEDIVSDYLEAAKEPFEVIGRAIQSGEFEGLLKGPVAHSGFKRLN